MALELQPFGRIVWEDRYGLKDEMGALVEQNIFGTFKRVAKAIASKEANPEIWEAVFYEIMSEGYFCPAGRILAHSGTHYSQLLNCFVLPFKDDSLESIMQTAAAIAVTQKHGGGVGISYSRLRPAGSYIKGVNGRSCGVIGFLSMNSVVSEVIEQGGSRRGANLGLLEVWHPDIWEFISYKTDHNWDSMKEFIEVKDEEQWAAFKFENLYKWQMYNVSVGVNDEFFQVLKEDGFWPLMWDGKEWELYTVVFKKKTADGYREKRFEVTADGPQTAIWKAKKKIPFPTSKDIIEVESLRKIKASEIWERLCYNAWADGCPGLLNMSTIRKYHNLEYARPIEATNPCLTGDTLVAVADGRVAVSIKQLAEKGEDVPVYCRNDKGKVTIRMMRRPRVTGYSQKILKVTFEGGHSVRVTENHKFVFSDDRVVLAKDVKSGDSLSIMNRLQSPFEAVLRHSNSMSQDYYWINSTGNNSWILDHRLIYNFYNPKSLSFQEAIHHEDCNGLNNDIKNLCKMTKVSHDQLHAIDKMGDKNPMRRAQVEWSAEKWQEYHNNMSASVSGESNGRFSGISNEDLFNKAVELTKERGVKLTIHEWSDFALINGYPSQFSDFRKDVFGTVVEFLEKAAIEAGVEGAGLRHAQLRSFQRFLKLREESDLDLFFDGGIKVRKKCEGCGEIFVVKHESREICYCSRQCHGDHYVLTAVGKKGILESKENQRVKKRLLQVNAFNDLKLKLGRLPMKKEYAAYCKDIGIPFRLPTSWDLKRNRIVGTFKNWGEFKESALLHNHRVVSVIEDGFDTVYNGTVDEYHNFYIGHFEEEHDGHKKYVYINNRQCGEQPLPANSSCLLSSLVLASFVKNKAIDYNTLGKVVRVAVRFMDDVIDNCEFPIKEIGEAEYSERRIGLGTMGVHDMLIALEQCYDSETGRDTVEAVLTFIRDTAYMENVQLAKEKGPFPLFDRDKYMQSEFIKTLPEKIRQDIYQYGVRCSCMLSQAPTGTIGALFNASTGCEPWFSLVMQRNTRLGSYEDGCPAYLKWKKENPGVPIPPYFRTAQDISPEDHIKMLVLFSKYIDSAVSKTINMANSATVKDVSDAFLMAMGMGVKGITVFRDGSKEGVLVSKDKIKDTNKDTISALTPDPVFCDDVVEQLDSRVAPKKRGNRVTGATTRVHMQHHNLYVTVNKNTNNNIIELFATVGESKNPNTHHTSGVEDSWAEGLGKIASLALRAGVNPDAIIRNLKNIPSDKPVFTTIGACENSELIPSPPHAIARVLEEEAKYQVGNEDKVEGGVLSGPVCAECGSTNTKKKSPSCYECLDCSYSGCGG